MTLREAAWASLALLGIGCGASRPSTSLAQAPPSEVSWSSALEPSPEILLAFDPKALEHDRVCGPLLRRALDLAAQHSRAAAGTRLVDVMAEADQVLVQTDADALEGDTTQPQSLVVVLIGVRADIDPEKLTDADGHLLWNPGPYGPVRELAHETDPDGTPNPASLFELPNRTWVIASGNARGQVRDAFARPSSRPPPPLDPDALAQVRLDGLAFAAHVPLVRSGSMLSGIGQNLQSVVIALEGQVPSDVDAGAPPSSTPQATDIRAVLAYADESSAATAEVTMTLMIETLGRIRPSGLEWVGDATATRTGRDLVLSLPHSVERLAALLYRHPSPN